MTEKRKDKEEEKVKWYLSVGDVARRSGVSVATLHFYEQKGLIHSARNAGNQRRYPRYILRLVSVIKVAQRVGISLAEIKQALDQLPQGSMADQEDWECLSLQWQAQLDEKINWLLLLRDQMTSCIGCGCLSLNECPLRNPDDELSLQGAGPQLTEVNT